MKTNKTAFNWTNGSKVIFGGGSSITFHLYLFILLEYLTSEIQLNILGFFLSLGQSEYQDLNPDRRHGGTNIIHSCAYVVDNLAGFNV